MSSTDSGSSKPKAATTYVPLSPTESAALKERANQARDLVQLSPTERAALKERANRARDLLQRLRMDKLTQSSVHLTQKPS